MIIPVFIPVIAAEAVIDLGAAILRLRLIYFEPSAVEFLSVQLPDRQRAFGQILHFDKRKPT